MMNENVMIEFRRALFRKMADKIIAEAYKGLETKGKPHRGTFELYRELLGRFKSQIYKWDDVLWEPFRNVNGRRCLRREMTTMIKSSGVMRK
jgi:hypothetical protein